MMNKSGGLVVCLDEVARLVRQSSQYIVVRLCGLYR